jgi:hypothetical protein
MAGKNSGSRMQTSTRDHLTRTRDTRQDGGIKGGYSLSEGYTTTSRKAPMKT